MENATKALLIAAAVLIAIVLIAVGIKLLSSSEGVVNETGKVADATKLSIHNSQFTDYEGTQTGVQVRALLNKVAATWRNNESRNVSATMNGTIYSSANDVATLRSSININSTYTVNVSYDDNGYVNSVTIN